MWGTGGSGAFVGKTVPRTVFLTLLTFFKTIKAELITPSPTFGHSSPRQDCHRIKKH